MGEQITITAVIAIAFIHTIVGPDHYLPFIVMSKARSWSLVKTIWITFICGIGHILSTFAIGIIGVTSGFLMQKIEIFDGYRGSMAAWALMIFGLIYFAWGVYRVIKNKTHKHIHIHENGEEHVHEHKHSDGHSHVHNKKITPWALFIIFVLGPCEAMVPILAYPAIENDYGKIIFFSIVFAFITIATMIAVVVIAFYGINLLPLGKFEKYTHAIAGAIIFLSGFAIEVLGL